MDLNALMNMRQAISQFAANHPKFPAFLSGVKSRGFCPGQEIAIAVRYPDGQEFKTGIRVTESDLQLLEMLKSMDPNM